jgi:hypothetical protein
MELGRSYSVASRGYKHGERQTDSSSTHYFASSSSFGGHVNLDQLLSAMDSSSLRKDDINVSNIIDRLTNDPFGDTDDVSSETKASKERVLARAKLALSDATIDRDDLHQQFTILTRLINFERESQRSWYLADVGDWVAGIVNIAKSMEPAAKVSHQNQLQNHLKATGLSSKAALNTIEIYDKWLFLKGNFASDYWVILQEELVRIRSWSLTGRKAGEEPETPGLVCVFIFYFCCSSHSQDRHCSLTQTLLVP